MRARNGLKARGFCAAKKLRFDSYLRQVFIEGPEIKANEQIEVVSRLSLTQLERELEVLRKAINGRVRGKHSVDLAVAKEKAEARAEALREERDETQERYEDAQRVLDSLGSRVEAAEARADFPRGKAKGSATLYPRRPSGRLSVSWEIRQGDCLEVLREMGEASVDAVVTDPPYGLEFMGKEWDRLGALTEEVTDTRNRDGNWTSKPFGGGGQRVRYGLNARSMQEWHHAWAVEALRVLKPGGHLLAFGGTRTYHRLACAVEDAGFEVRDSLIWLYGSGFPKSLDVSKAIDKAAGAEREIVGHRESSGYPDGDGVAMYANRAKSEGSQVATEGAPAITAPATPEAQRWQGWGTALKPGHEPIVVARKPLSGTVAQTVLEHGTGALNIDGCRIESKERWEGDASPYSGDNGFGPGDADGWSGNWSKRSESHGAGRWPANVVLDEQAAGELDAQSGERPHSARESRRTDHATGMFGLSSDADGYGDSGGASRFFYVAKAAREERGPENKHPTVKPVELMRWLCRLVTPPEGLILDPFAGSGTTGIAALREGFSFIGIERESEYVELARNRIRDDQPLFNHNSEVPAKQYGLAVRAGDGAR